MRSTLSPPAGAAETMSQKKIKCVVWDLDHTVWSGILLEGDTLALRPGVRELIEAFDERGILQSVASRNESAPAREQLKKFGLEQYFLHPQINWDPKSESVRRIAERLNIGLDTFAFIDDQAFERDEVRFSLPTVRTYDAAEIDRLRADHDFVPRVITEDARRRRRSLPASAGADTALAACLVRTGRGADRPRIPGGARRVRGGDSARGLRRGRARRRLGPRRLRAPKRYRLEWR
jgi:HAD superfamily phosphatase (TIGR01681 family)